jgi:hypothetical protein
MTQTQDTQVKKEKFQFLFKELTIFLKNHGARSLLFQLKHMGNTFDLEEIEIDDQLDILNSLTSCFKDGNIDYLYLMFQNKTRLNVYEPTEILFNKVFEIVTDIYKTDKELILDKNNRDGVRLYAIGTVFKLLIETIGYTPDEIVSKIGKSRSIISRHKNMITYLDENHPMDRKFIIKYITCKQQLIKFLLDEYQEKAN